MMSKQELTYVYRLEDPVNGMAYIGSRTCKGITSVVDDDAYRGSAKSNKWKDQWDEISKRCNKTIIDVFTTREEALELEIKLHKLYNVKDNSRFYNEANQTSTKFTAPADMWTPELRKHYSKINKVRMNTEESKDAVSKRMIQRYLSEELREVERQRTTALWKTPEFRQKHKEGMAKVDMKKACEKRDYVSMRSKLSKALGKYHYFGVDNKTGERKGPFTKTELINLFGSSGPGNILTSIRTNRNSYGFKWNREDRP